MAAKTIDKYEILEELGRGTFGVVYKARDADLDRTVAVKVLRPGWIDSPRGTAARQSIERFRDEGRQIAKLSPHKHQSIADVLEAGRDAEGRYFMVTQYIPGPNLADWLKDNDMTPQQAVGIVRRLADALQVMHAHGILHRDVKPRNIVLQEDLHPVLVDFGLAAPIEASSPLDRFEGSPPYHSPEQAQRTSPLDPRTDIYSLGSVFYELLTGEQPYFDSRVMRLIRSGADHEQIAAAARSMHAETEALHPVDDFENQVPPRLVEMCQTAMHGEPDKRFRQAADFSAQLQAYLDRSRYRRRLVASCVLFVLTAIAIGIAAVAGLREDDAPTNTAFAEAREAASRYFADMHRAHEALLRSDVDRVHELLQSWRPSPGRPDLRGWEWYYLLAMCHRDAATQEFPLGALHSVRCSPKGDRLAVVGTAAAHIVPDDFRTPPIVIPGHTAIAWAPDGRALACAAAEGSFTVWDVDTVAARFTCSAHPAVVRALAWSPDGAQLASASEGNSVKLSDSADGRLLHTLGGPQLDRQNWKLDLAWNRDSTRIAAAARSGAVTVWNTSEQTELFSIPAHSGQASAVVWSTDGANLASAGADGTVKLWRATDGQILKILHGHTAPVLTLAWHPAAPRLASAGRDRSILIWNPQTGRSLLSLSGHTDSITGLAWTPDGQKLVSASMDGTVKVWSAALAARESSIRPALQALSPAWDRVAATVDDRDFAIRDSLVPTVLSECRGHERGILALAWSPDGRSIASAAKDRTVRVWDVATGQQRAVHRGHQGFVNTIDWSPDGTRLASGGDDHMLCCWDPHHNRPQHTLAAHTASVLAVAWSPDGTQLASAGADGHVNIWNTNGWTRIHALTGHPAPVRAVAWSPRQNELVSGAADGTLVLWSLADGKRRLTIRGHSAAVQSVAWDPGQIRIASRSEDGTVKLWDVHTGQEAIALRPPLPEATPVVWSRDGQRLAATSVWDASRGYAIADAPPPAVQSARQSAGTTRSACSFSERFDAPSLDLQRWQIGRPSVNLQNRHLVLKNRGYLVSSCSFPQGLRLTFDWRWIDLVEDSAYADHVTIAVRSSGQPRLRRAYEAVDGLLIKIDAASGSVLIQGEDGSKIDATPEQGLDLPPDQWHQIQITDDRRTITIFVNDSEHPRLQVPVPDKSSAGRFAIYNREHVGGPHESHLDNITVTAGP